MGKSQKNVIHGWINLDKDIGITSTKALNKLKAILNVKKAGHAGTLDPLATGCLPIALGEATKTIQFAQNRLKTYEFEISWGESRSTDDLEGEIINTSEARPGQNLVEDLLAEFTGNILQTPPQFAAVKIDGKRAYEIARSGEKAEIKPRDAYIKSLDILEHKPDKTTMRAVCGKGVYIRAIARDMGEKLGCYGYISSLRRLKVGPFDENTMITLDNLEKIMHSGDLQTALMPVESMLDDIPAVDLTREEAARVKQGQKVGLYSKPQVERLEKAGIILGIKDTPTLAYATFKGVPIAVVAISGAEIKPERVLNL